MMPNPGSIAKLQFEISLTVPSIRRMFLSIDALKKGFMASCQPFIRFDGCHLKGPYGGVLLFAIGLDGNKGLYPLTFSMVKSENYDSWCFFFDWLVEFLDGFPANRPWAFMTDRQKVRHSFLADLKNNHITNNIAESFNNWVGKFRGKPILTLMESLRSCTMLFTCSDKFQVKDNEVSSIVNINQRTCDCKVWNLTGIPCNDGQVPIARTSMVHGDNDCQVATAGTSMTHGGNDDQVPAGETSEAYRGTQEYIIQPSQAPILETPQGSLVHVIQLMIKYCITL
ncbi:hypothetical protein ACH5RR_015002 [Cinchona calisaya]|uniref:MULE transposase domain-containing protein n=1 Tax=Cinchona calisaya TaxID=153742 RepID=A0ABD2ZX57_9GENT